VNQKEVDEFCEGVPYNPNGRGGRRKPKYGVGINDLPHITQFTDVDGKTRMHSGYNQWCSMIGRCYSDKLHLRQYNNPSHLVKRCKLRC